MTESVRTAAYASLVLIGLLGCGGDDDPASEGEMIAASQDAALRIYDSPYAPDMPDVPNPIARGAKASAMAFDDDGQLRIVLEVTGFPASRAFGSHLHRLACDDPMKAGGHYQHMPFPSGGMAMDPTYANATNEAWLDFTTDARGNAERQEIVSWIPRSGEAKAIIFHNMTTASGGVAGPKLACLPINGF